MRLRTPLVALVTALVFTGCSTSRPGALHQRTGFIALTNFSQFTSAPGNVPDEVLLTSPEINPPVAWNELIVSWNVAEGTHLKVEARGLYPDHATKFYTLGFWSENPAQYPRASVNGQPDSDGTVKTDTLVLQRPGAKVQLRLTLGGSAENTTTPLKFIGLSFCDSRAQAIAAQPNCAAWGHTIVVPERLQSGYEDSGGWCSPACLSMVLAYWSRALHRPELDRPVPEIAAAVNDPVYNGTGNWPFNTAYAGKFPGLRAYVTRLSDVSELEDWIAAGIPVTLSVSSYLTNDREIGPDQGHLIVCVGFTEDGDLVANDAGVSLKEGQRVRRVYAREKVAHAWKKSKNTVYLVYPETSAIPISPRGDWELR